MESPSLLGSVRLRVGRWGGVVGSACLVDQEVQGQVEVFEVVAVPDVL